MFLVNGNFEIVIQLKCGVWMDDLNEKMYPSLEGNGRKRCDKLSFVIELLGAIAVCWGKIKGQVWLYENWCKLSGSNHEADWGPS